MQMREILFRGKRADNGKWVMGNLVKSVIDGDVFYLIFGEKFLYEENEVTAGLHALVDPATIGQYTGLKDKNGKRIFEGDILKVHSGYCDEDTYITQVWVEGATLCVFVQGEDYDYTAVNFADDLWANTDYEPEVIGNIHDNPELLKDGADG